MSLQRERFAFCSACLQLPATVGKFVSAKMLRCEEILIPYLFSTVWKLSDTAGKMCTRYSWCTHVICQLNISTHADITCIH